MLDEKGIIVGCDLKQEWLLPYWWENYSSHNSYPVVFVDFGMSKEARNWCKEKGTYTSLESYQRASLGEDLSLEKKKAWEDRYGEGIWSVRSAWLKKPYALYLSSFSFGLWLDLDCQVQGNLEPIFNCLQFAEIAVAKDRGQSFKFLQDGEINYNSGVIAFRKEAKILRQWIESLEELENQLPGDQELLNRAILSHKPALFELPAIYNWDASWGQNDQAVVRHYCGGLGKIEILKSLDPSYFYGIGVPKKWTAP